MKAQQVLQISGWTGMVLVALGLTSATVLLSIEEAIALRLAKRSEESLPPPTVKPPHPGCLKFDGIWICDKPKEIRR